MLFNPLFLQVINNQETISTKTQKLSNSSYLFSDIIKVSVENEMQNSGSIGLGKTMFTGDSAPDIIGKQMVNIPLELKFNTTNNISVESVLEQLIQQLQGNNHSENLQKSGLTDNIFRNINPGDNNETRLLDQNKVCELITKLVNNSEFNGKANLVIDRQKLLQDNYSSALDEITKNEITPETLLDLLKMGNTISLENSPAEKNLGLLITLIEHNNDSESGTELKNSDGYLDLGVKNIFKIKNDELSLKDILGESQNQGSQNPVMYEIKISVIDQSANINQNENFAAQGLEIAGESSNKIKVDIILKDSVSDNKNDLGLLSKITPPEEMFASTAVNAKELSKVSSSFSNSLNADAQQLKTITKNNQDVIKNLTSSVSDKEVIPAGTNLNEENVLGANSIKEVKSTIIKPESVNNNISGISPENVPAFTKISGSLKNQFSANKESSQPSNSGNLQNQPAETDRGLFVKVNNTMTKETSAKADVKVNNVKSVKSESVNPEFKIEEIKTEGFSKESSGQVKVEQQDNEKNSLNTVNVKTQVQEKTETVNEPANTEKNPLMDKNVNNEIDKNVNKDADVSSKNTDQKINNSESKVSDNKAADVKITDNKTAVETKESIPAAAKESVKANAQPVNNDTAAARVNNSENIEPQEKNVESIKSEINQNTKANPNTGESTNTEDNNQGNSLSDSNKNSDENKKSNDGKIVNEASFDKAFETVSKDKVGMEKGHYTDAARIVKAAEIAKEISKHIQARENGTIYLKIDPEHLGTVKIAIEVIDKMVHANIEVENESARKLMENNLNQLYSNLNQNGVQLNSLNISLSNFEQKQGKAFASKRKSSGYGEESDTAENSNVNKEKTLGYNTYEYTV